MTDVPIKPSTGPSGDRYGRPAPWRRTAIIVASGLVGVLALSWLAWTTLFHATPEVRSEIVGWEVVDDHAVTAQIEVVISSDAEKVEATCRVRATASDHTIVGEATFDAGGRAQRGRGADRTPGNLGRVGGMHHP